MAQTPLNVNISPSSLASHRPELPRASHTLNVNISPSSPSFLYVLYNLRPKLKTYDVVYVGMTLGGRGGIRGRLKGHRRKKVGLWTHCSIFEVWDNIRDDEIVELEGLFRHIYRYDSRANKLNKQRGFKKLKMVRDSKFWEWDKE